MLLRQSTSQVIRFGPFLDSTDGVTAETALTIAQADMQISKDGAAFAQKNTTGNATHDTDGWYYTTLDATDTATVGELIMQVVVAGSIPVWVRYWVVEEAIYDAIYGAAATGFNASGQVVAASLVGHTVQTGDNYARLGAPAGASIAADLVVIDNFVDELETRLTAARATNLDELGALNIPADIDTLLARLTAARAGYLDELAAANMPADLDAVLADTNELQTDDVPGLIAALNDPTAAVIADAVLDEALSAHIVAGSLGKAVADIETDSTAILADTNELQADWVNGGRLDLLIDGIKAVTDLLPDSGALTTLITHLTDIKGTGFVKDTNSMVDLALATAITALNDLSQAESQTAASAALTAINLDALLSVAMSSANNEVVDGSVIAKLAAITGTWSNFAEGTDSLQALRDRGDAAWTTGSGGTPPQLLQNTTIATLASQVSFTLSAGSADDNAYNGAMIIITDQSTSTQKAVGFVSTYTGATKTVTLAADPAIFTIAAGDTVDVIGASANVVGWKDSAVATPTVAGVPEADITHYNGVAGTFAGGRPEVNTTLIEGVDATNQIRDSLVDDATRFSGADLAAILVDTGTSIPALIAALNDLSAAEVNTQVDTALQDMELDHLLTVAHPTGTPTANSIFDLIMSKNASQTFARGTDSLEAVADSTGGDATAANQTTILNRLGAFTGSGDNTILGFFRSLFRADYTEASDIGGTYDAATDSLEKVGANTASITATTVVVTPLTAATNSVMQSGQQVEVVIGNKGSLFDVVLDGDWSAYAFRFSAKDEPGSSAYAIGPNDVDVGDVTLGTDADGNTITTISVRFAEGDLDITEGVYIGELTADDGDSSGAQLITPIQFPLKVIGGLIG